MSNAKQKPEAPRPTEDVRSGSPAPQDMEDEPPMNAQPGNHGLQDADSEIDDAVPNPPPMLPCLQSDSEDKEKIRKYLAENPTSTTANATAIRRELGLQCPLPFVVSCIVEIRGSKIRVTDAMLDRIDEILDEKVDANRREQERMAKEIGMSRSTFSTWYEKLKYRRVKLTEETTKRLFTTLSDSQHRRLFSDFLKDQQIPSKEKCQEIGENMELTALEVEEFYITYSNRLDSLIETFEDEEEALEILTENARNVKRRNVPSTRTQDYESQDRMKKDEPPMKAFSEDMMIQMKTWFEENPLADSAEMRQMAVHLGVKYERFYNRWNNFRHEKERLEKEARKSRNKAIFRAEFERNPGVIPDEARLKELVLETGMIPIRIKYWFRLHTNNLGRLEKIHNDKDMALKILLDTREKGTVDVAESEQQPRELGNANAENGISENNKTRIREYFLACGGNVTTNHKAIKLLQQNLNLATSQNKLIKFISALRKEQLGAHRVSNLNPEKFKMVRDVFKRNPNATKWEQRKIADDVGLPFQSVNAWWGQRLGDNRVKQKLKQWKADNTFGAFTNEQLDALEGLFKTNPHPEEHKKAKLGGAIGMKKTMIDTWFDYKNALVRMTRRQVEEEDEDEEENEDDNDLEKEQDQLDSQYRDENVLNSSRPSTSANHCFIPPPAKRRCLPSTSRAMDSEPTTSAQPRNQELPTDDWIKKEIKEEFEFDSI